MLQVRNLRQRKQERFVLHTRALARALDRHITEQHSGARVVWKCTTCGKVSRSYTECHFLKCRGVVRMPQAFPCEWYPDSYGTGTGRSQHERHAHP